MKLLDAELRLHGKSVPEERVEWVLELLRAAFTSALLLTTSNWRAKCSCCNGDEEQGRNAYGRARKGAMWGWTLLRLQNVTSGRRDGEETPYLCPYCYICL